MTTEQKTSKEAPEQSQSRLEEKWSKPLIASGYTVIPNVIIERQQALNVDALDMNIILHLACRWWEADRLPFPSKKDIAQRIGVSTSTIRRRIAEMEKGGLIKRKYRHHKEHGQQSSEYSLDGLIKGATPFAEEKIAARAEKEKERAEERTRKKPKVRKDNRTSNKED